MRNYLKIAMLVRDNSEEKVTSVVSGNWTKNEFLILFIALLVYDATMIILKLYGILLWFVLVITLFILLMYYIKTRRIGIGITNNKLILIKVSRFKFKVIEIDEIPYEKIKNIVTKKQFGNTHVKISYVSENGKFKKISFNYGKMLAGSEDYRVSAEAIYKKLVEIEKVIDKGDF